MKSKLMLLFGIVVCSLTIRNSLAQSNENSGDDKKPADELLVIGYEHRSYLIGHIDGLTGLDLDFLELPRVVENVSNKLILDQGGLNLDDVLRNVSGITQGSGVDGLNDDFFIRGFRRDTVYRDGFARINRLKADLSNVESVQVVLGPAAIKFGGTNPGGAVEIITKKPLEQQRISGQARLGSFNHRSYLLDWSQPLGENHAIRVIASNQNTDSFREFVEESNDALFLSGKFKLTEALKLDLVYDNQKQKESVDNGTFVVNTPNGQEIINNLIDIPIERRFSEPFGKGEIDYEFFEANLSYQFSDDWHFKLNIASEKSAIATERGVPIVAVIVDADSNIISPDGFIIGGGVFDSDIDLLAAEFDDPTDEVFLLRFSDASPRLLGTIDYFNAVVSGEFNALGANHRVNFGINARDIERSRVSLGGGC